MGLRRSLTKVGNHTHRFHAAANRALQRTMYRVAEFDGSQLQPVYLRPFSTLNAHARRANMSLLVPETYLASTLRNPTLPVLSARL